MGISLYLAKRLSLASSGRRSAPAVKVAVAAVAISLAVMIASVAIVLGFKNDIRDRITGFNSDITLYASPVDPEEQNIVTLDRSLQSILDSIPAITSYNLEVNVPAVLKTPTDFKGVYFKGFGTGADTEFLASSLTEGRLPSFGKATEHPEAVISRIAADQLGLHSGDFVETYFISDDIRVRKVLITGIYDTHFESYDNILMYGQIALLQELHDIRPDQGTTVRMKTADFDLVDRDTQLIAARMIDAYQRGEVNMFYKAENARTQGANYFAWLDLLDTNVVVILVLMTIVACITLISGMLIIIIDKMRFIGIVRSLGLRTSSLRRVFIYLSMRIAIIGLLIGNAVVLTVLAIQDATHFIPLDADSYYFDYVPVSMQWGAFAVVNIAALVIIFLMLLLPSSFAARISPARTMRYE